jgi:hypothetical protein
VSEPHLAQLLLALLRALLQLVAPLQQRGVAPVQPLQRLQPPLVVRVHNLRRLRREEASQHRLKGQEAGSNSHLARAVYEQCFESPPGQGERRRVFQLTQRRTENTSGGSPAASRTSSHSHDPAPAPAARTAACVLCCPPPPCRRTE